MFGLSRSRSWTLLVAVLVALGAVAALWAGRAQGTGTPTAATERPVTSTVSPEAEPTASATATATAEPSPSVTSPPPAPEPTTGPETGTVEPGPSTEPVVEQPAPPAPAGSTDVAIAFLGWTPATASVDATGYAATVEADGACTLTLTQGSRTVRSAESAALPDASTTTCGTLSVPRAQLGPGTWSATIAYRSASSVGSSPAMTVDVPR
jgi:cytoskeletal protein RodZ